VLYRLAADAVLLLHLAFVAFVVLGGFLVLRWRKLAWAHLPAVAWGVLVEFSGWICPLTPLEIVLRQAAGDAAYAGDFVEHYIVALLYPESLTRDAQVTLGVAVVLLNAVIYGAVLRQFRRQRA
jgi:Protein of Unknown function (DUF2784)